MAIDRHVGFFVETVYGTSGIPARFLEVLSEDLHLERNMEDIVTIDHLSPVDSVELSRWVRGTVTHKANFDGIGLLFEHLYGVVETTGAGPYTHKFPHSTTGIPDADRIGKSLSIEVNRDADSWRYTGCKIIAMELTITPAGIPEMTWEFIGKDEDTSAAAATPTFPTRLLLFPKNSTVILDGGSALPVTSATIRFENPLDDPLLLGGVAYGKEPDRSGPFMAKFSMDVHFDDPTDYYTKWDGAIDVDLEFKIDNATESLTFNMNKMRLMQATPPMTGRERLTASVEGIGVFDTIGTEMCGTELVNNDATA